MGKLYAFDMPIWQSPRCRLSAGGERAGAIKRNNDGN